ncbi:MAG: hypothetical protein ACTSX6_14065 [Candidatus Heimdallarchaeaceae archaeon]
MKDEKIKSEFKEVFTIFCNKIKLYREKHSLPKNPIFVINGTIIEDINKINQNEDYINNWYTQAPNFYIEKP